jgi:cyanate permease
MVFNATGPFIASIAYDALGNYTMVFLVFAFLVMVSAVLMFMAKPPSPQPSTR